MKSFIVQTPAYYDAELITAVKSFKAQALGHGNISIETKNNWNLSNSSQMFKNIFSVMQALAE